MNAADAAAMDLWLDDRFDLGSNSHPVNPVNSSPPVDGSAARAASPATAKRSRKQKPRKQKPTCADCFFQRNMLCALDAAEPCPTFRDHEQGLKPERQLSFVFRQERVRTAWIFEQRQS